MKCSREMLVFIYVGVGLCVGIALLVPSTSAREKKKRKDLQIVASQSANDPNFKKIDETSGIALAGFRDKDGRPLLWAHNEKTSRVALIATGPDGPLYVGAVTMPGARTRDAEDIATVHDHGRNIIYLEDAGANRKDMPACVRYAREKEDPSQCRVADAVIFKIDKKSTADKQAGKQACLARGSDWIWLEETDYLAPGVHPAIRRIPEPTYAGALREQMAMATAVVKFDYPRQCGARPCRELAGDKTSAIARAYNTEALAVVVEPDRSHTAYLLTKAPLSLFWHVKRQHPEAADCRFASDGLSDVFRIRHIDSLSPTKVHQAEYVTTLDFSAYDSAASGNHRSYRVTAANFLQLSDSQGLLLVRTNGSAYKWPVSLTHDANGSGAARVFDVAGALESIEPVAAAVPTSHKKQGVNKRNQEAVAQFDASTIYYMGECKGLRECSVAMVHDNHPYLAGDVDGNGRVDAEDVKLLNHFLSGGTNLYCQAAADVNGDNRIDQADLEYLRQYVDGRGPAPVRSVGQTGGVTMLSCGYYAAVGNSHRGLQP